MPCRVLDTELRSSNGDMVHLLEPAQSLSKPAPYASLSYCWGSDLDGIAMTTKSNKGAHYDGILLNSLPRTVRDAVLVCQGLGIRYLWVDALCIVQDDSNDWQREAAQMGQIYLNSHITIAAHAPASCQEGFLGKQDYGQRSWQREFWTEFGTHCGRSKRRKFFIRMCTFARMQKFDKPSALTQRGWTLQETILPPRILHYTGAEMAWECNTRHFCECGHVSEDMPMVKTELSHRSSFHQGTELAVDGWMQLIERYSNRGLTHRSDKLVAISGLVQIYGAKLCNSNGGYDTAKLPNSIKSGAVQKPPSHGSAYLAGLFRTALQRHLLWYTGDPRLYSGKSNLSISPSNHRASNRRAPTWSWASVDTPIKYLPLSSESQVERSHIVVHDGESFCKPLFAENPVEAVSVGELLLEGSMVPVRLIIIEQTPGSIYDISENWPGSVSFVRSRNGWTERVSCDVPRDLEFRKGDPRYNCWDRNHNPLDPEYSCWDQGYCRCSECNLEKEQWSEPQFCCLKVATYLESVGTSIYFLLLERSEAIAGVWERVGVGVKRYGSVDFEDDDNANKGFTEADKMEFVEDAKIEKLRII